LKQRNATMTEFRAAATEFLMTRVSDSIQREAERQVSALFPPHGQIPPDLITVHIRWGDKARESKLVPIERYIDAVNEIVSLRQAVPSTNASTESRSTVAPVHIYLASEDPDAVNSFLSHRMPYWKVYIDRYFTELAVKYRSPVYNGPNHMALQLRGLPGRLALASLLVAAEANEYILTTSSNWSRLMNEIRLNILNPRCGDCTRMLDLHPGQG
jgi:hypothetical protein